MAALYFKCVYTATRFKILELKKHNTTRIRITLQTKTECSHSLPCQQVENSNLKI